MSEANERWLWPGEVGRVLRVNPKTVTRWADEGRLPSVRLPGGHRRFLESDVRALMKGERTDLDSVLAKAREVADKVTFDWSDPEMDGPITVLAYFGGACEFASGDAPAAVLAEAVEKLRAYRAGGVR